MANNDNVVMLDPKSPEFDTPDQAARALTGNFDPKAGRERAGAIVKTPAGKYVYTSTIDAGKDHFDMRARLPKDHTFAGILHNHPEVDSNLDKFFSPNDLQTADTLQVPSYVFFDRDQSVRKYVPGVTKTRMMADPSPPHFNNMKVADGDPVAQSVPVGSSTPTGVQGSPTQPSTAEVAVTGQEFTDDHDAQDIPVIDRREAANRVRSGGADASGKLAGPAMVDTRTPGDSSSAQTPAPADKWEARLRALGPDLPPEDPAAAKEYTAKNPAPSSTRAPEQQPPLNKWEARLQSLGPDQPPPPAPAPPAAPRKPSYLSSFGQGVKGVAEQGRQLLSLLGYTLMPWGASASEGGDAQAQEDLSADPTQQDQKDNYFRNVVDPATRGIQETELPPDATFGEKLSHGLGATAAMIAEAIVTGGGSLEATTAETAAGRVAQRAASGAAAMSVPAAQNAVDTGRRVLEATGDKRAAVIAGVTSYATTAAQGAIPMGIGGKILTRMATGAGIGVAAGEANRVVSNASMPDSMQQPFNIQEDALNAITGSLFGALPSHSSNPQTLADRRTANGLTVQEQPHTMMEQSQAIAAAKAAAEGGDKLSQVVAATGINAEMGAHYHAGEYEGHIATRHAQVAEEQASRDALDAETARTAAFNQAQGSKTAGVPSPDDAFAARERQQSQAKDQDFTAARNQKADQTVARANDEDDTARAGAEKGGATQPAPTIADALPPGTLQALKSLQERRAAEAGKATSDNSPAAVAARIKASTPPEEDFVKLPPGARGEEPAPGTVPKPGALDGARFTDEEGNGVTIQHYTDKRSGREVVNAIHDNGAPVGLKLESPTVQGVAEALGKKDGGDWKPAPTPANRLAAIRQAAEKRAAQAAEKPQERSTSEPVQSPAENSAAQPPASLAARRAETAAPKADFDRLAAARPREVVQLVSKLSPEEAAGHLERLDDSDFDNAPLRDALQRRAQSAEKPQAARTVEREQGPTKNPIGQTGKTPKAAKAESPESAQTAGMVSLANRRAAAEAATAQEGRWQNLMAAKPAEAVRITGEMPIEEAQRHLDRLDAAPGDNAVARKALEARIAESAPASSTAAEIKEAARASAYHPDNDLPTPTEAQYRAGNYAKAHIKFKGMDVSIEHPAGSERPLGDGSTRTMPADYGYIRNTEAADHQHVDVLIGRHPESDTHYLVDHLDRSGNYEQTKVLSGFNNRIEAMRAYKKMYPDHPAPPVSEVSTPELKNWLAHGDTTRPFDQKAVNRLGDNRVRLSTAAEKPTHPEAVEHSTEDAGTGKVRHVYTLGQGELHAVEDRSAGVTRVVHADAGPPSVRGRGVGTSMLERAISDAHARGQRFESDQRVSAPQQGTYRSLSERGYDVSENPSTVDRGTGEKVSKSELKGVYSVKPKADSLAARRSQAANHVAADAARAQPLTHAEATRTLKPIVDHLNGKGGGVQVHADESTLPGNISDAMKASDRNQIRGAYDPENDAIHIVAGSHTSHEELLRTAIHEIAHKGLDNLFESRDEYNHTMDEIYRSASDRAWLKNYAADHNIDARTASGRRLIADEYAAHLAEKVDKDPSLWQKIVDTVRTGLRKLGVVRDWSDADIRALVQRASSKLMDHDSSIADSYKAAGVRFADVEHPVTESDRSDAAFAHKLGRTVEEQSAYSPGFIRRARDYTADTFGGKGYQFGLYSTALRNLKDFHVAKQMPGVEGFIRTFDRMQGRVGQLKDARSQVLRDWSSWATKNKEQAKDLGELMHSSTLAGVDPSKPFTKIYADSTDPAKIAVDDMRKGFHASAKKAYEGLDATGKQLFNKVRDDYASHRQQVMDALEQRIENSSGSDASKKNLIAAMRQKFESGRVQGPYFPLQRFGDHWAAAKNESGETMAFTRFESVSKKKAWVARMQSEGYSVTGGKFKDVKSTLGEIDPNFVKKVADIVGDSDPHLAEEVWHEYLRQLPDSSIRKHFLPRVGRLGYTMDALRTYADNSVHGSNQLARLEFGSQLDKHMRDIENQAQAINDTGPTASNAEEANAMRDEMGARYKNILNPQHSALAAFITKMGYRYFLGFNPGTAIRIKMQNAQLAAPLLAAHYGQLGARKELWRATTQWSVARGDLADTLRGDERTAFDTAHEMGTFSSPAAHDLADAASQGSPIMDAIFGERPEGRYATPEAAAARAVSRASTAMLNLAENANRQTTYLAAYRLERSAGADHNTAVENAIDRVWDAHYDYRGEARPRILQSPVGRVAGQFMVYPFGVLHRMIRDGITMLSRDESVSPEARKIAIKTFAGMMLTTGALYGGATGLPGSGIVASIVNHYAGDKDHPYDAEGAWHHYLEQRFGRWSADAILYGMVSATTHTALSSAASLNADLLYHPPRQNETVPGMFEDLTGRFLGPLYSAAHGMAEGAQEVHDGQIERGIEHFLPPALGNVMKAIRYAREGVRTLHGDQTMPRNELSNWDILLQAIGITPQKVADRQLEATSLKNVSKDITDRPSSLAKQYAQADYEGDEDAKKSTMDEISKYNEAQPTAPVNGLMLKRAVKELYMQRDGEGGVKLPKELNYLKDIYGGGAESTTEDANQ